ERAQVHRELQEAATRAAAETREAEAELVEAQRALAQATRAVEERTAAVARLTAELAAVEYDPTEHDRLKAAVAVLDQRAGAETAFAAACADLEGAREAAQRS